MARREERNSCECKKRKRLRSIEGKSEENNEIRGER